MDFPSKIGLVLPNRFNVCRCCLKEVGSKDISTYFLHSGEKESFDDMLENTFNVQVPHPTTDAKCYKICEACIGSLRDASTFKRNMVLRGLYCDKESGHSLQAIDQFSKNIIVPFDWPNIRNEHFYLNTCRFIPSQNIHTRTDFRMKLCPGPGVDHLGLQKPIPNESIIKRLGDNTQEAKKGKKTGKKMTNQLKDENVILEKEDKENTRT